MNVRQTILLPPGKEAKFLAHYPATLLPVDGETIRQLHLLGLRTLGQVAALPAPAMLDRFGRQGRLMHRLARGRDTSSVQPYTPKSTERLDYQFESPVADRTIVERTLAVMARELALRLQSRGETPREIVLTLRLESGAAVEQALILRQPAASSDYLVLATQELVAAMQVTSGVIEAALSFDDIVPVVARQLSLFEREPVQQKQLHEILKTLIARYGDECFYWAAQTHPTARLPERRFELRKVSEE